MPERRAAPRSRTCDPSDARTRDAGRAKGNVASWRNRLALRHSEAPQRSVCAAGRCSRHGAQSRATASAALRELDAARASGAARQPAGAAPLSMAALLFTRPLE